MGIITITVTITVTTFINTVISSQDINRPSNEESGSQGIEIYLLKEESLVDDYSTIVSLQQCESPIDLEIRKIYRGGGGGGEKTKVKSGEIERKAISRRRSTSVTRQGKENC